MNKKVLIFGGVALVSLVAFFYLKPKLKSLKTMAGLGSDTAGESIPPKGAVLTSPEEVEAITVKIATARDLTKTICDLKKEYNITQYELSVFMNFSGFSSFMSNATSVGQSNAIRMKKRKEAINTIINSVKELKDLGYKEDNCKTVKIA